MVHRRHSIAREDRSRSSGDRPDCSAHCHCLALSHCAMRGFAPTSSATTWHRTHPKTTHNRSPSRLPLPSCWKLHHRLLSPLQPLALLQSKVERQCQNRIVQPRAIPIGSSRPGGPRRLDGHYGLQPKRAACMTNGTSSPSNLRPCEAVRGPVRPCEAL